MADVVGRVVRDGAERECQLVDVAGVAHERLHEVARPHVVHQIRELFAAERVVAEILDDRSTVGERARPLQADRIGGGKSLPQRRHDGVVPQRVDHRLVGQDRIRGRGTRGGDDRDGGEEQDCGAAHVSRDGLRGSCRGRTPAFHAVLISGSAASSRRRGG